MTFVDTNILLRWLLADHTELTPQAEQIIETAKKGELIVTDIVASEVAYVLRQSGRDRSQTVLVLQLIADTPALQYENEEAISDVLLYFETTRLDFADCYLMARAKISGAGLQTFDKSLQKVYEQAKSP